MDLSRLCKIGLWHFIILIKQIDLIFRKLKVRSKYFYVVALVSGPHEYDVSSKISWQGVAILCELNLSQLNQLMKQNSSSTDDIERILLGI